MSDKTQLIQKLILAQIGSCTCLTKTPEVSWHDATCRYRVLAEVAEELRAVLAQEACTSCDGSGEYIDVIGDWRGYCSCPAGIELKNRPGQEAGHVEPVAYQRKWDADGITPYKEKNKNGRMAWAKKFIFVPITKLRIFPDDVALYSSPPAPASVVLNEVRALLATTNYSASRDCHNAQVVGAACDLLDKVKELNQ